jgi:hypothetical protein
VNDQHESVEPGGESRHEQEDPDVSGTVFLMVLFLMAIAGLWLIMYFMLLGR